MLIIYVILAQSTPSPQHDKSSSLLAQMQMQAKYHSDSKHYLTHDSKHFMGDKHSLQFPPPMQYMGMPTMSGMTHLSSWQLAAH